MFKEEIPDELLETWEDEKTGMNCGCVKDEMCTTFIELSNDSVLINKTVHEIVKEFPELNIDNRIYSIVNRDGRCALIYIFCKDEDYIDVKGKRTGNVTLDLLNTLEGNLIVKNGRDLNYIKDFCAKITQEIKKLMIN